MHGRLLARWAEPQNHHGMPSLRKLEKAPYLTPMENEVLLLLCSADCLLEKEMPEAMNKSLSTFKTHKEKLYDKMRVDTRQKLIAEAVRLGMVLCYCQQLRERLAGGTVEGGH